MDSLDFLNFVEVLGERAGVHIDDEDTSRLSTLSSSADFLITRTQWGRFFGVAVTSVSPGRSTFVHPPLLGRPPRLSVVHETRVGSGPGRREGAQCRVETAAGLLGHGRHGVDAREGDHGAGVDGLDDHSVAVATDDDVAGLGAPEADCRLRGSGRAPCPHPTWP